MSTYQITTKMRKPAWQVVNQAQTGQFVCDTENSAPGPVDYFTGAVNACILISARMVAKTRGIELPTCSLATTAVTSDLGHGLSKITGLEVNWHLQTNLTADEQAKFVAHVLHVSTVYQTIKDALPVKIKVN